MDAQTFLNNLGTIADAPGGIQHVRKLILELAVRGALVNQDVSEGAQELKATVNGPFQIPQSWSWLRLSDFVKFKVGKTPPTKDPGFWGDSESTMWVSISDMTNGGFVTESARRVTKRARADVFKHDPWPTGTMLMSFKLTIGKVSRLGQPAYFNEAIMSFDSGNPSTNEFLFRVLPLLSQSANAKGAIKGNTLNSDSISNILIPLPPESEQVRIVSKVDELVDLCDELEAAKNKRDSLRTAARKSAIDAISTATRPEEITKSWKRISSKWISFCNSPEDISSLRSLIIELALRGQLCESIEGSESAQTLLARISREHKPFEAMSSARFEIPVHWQWVPVGSVCQHQLGKMLNSSKTTGVRRKYLRTANVGQRGRFDLSNVKEMLIPEEEVDKYDVLPGDLFVNEGGDVGKSAIWRAEDGNDFAFQNHLHRLRPLGGIKSEYLHLVLQQARNSGAIAAASAGVTIQNFSARTLRSLACPLPPITEQEEIVERVQELMNLCDKLEAASEQRDSFQELLAKAVALRLHA